MQFQRPALSTTLSLSLLCGAMPATLSGVATLRAAPEASPAKVEKEDGSMPAPAVAPDENKATSGPGAPLPQGDESVTSRVVMELDGGRFPAWSADGNTLAAAGGSSWNSMFETSDDKGEIRSGVEIKMWNAKTERSRLRD